MADFLEPRLAVMALLLLTYVWRFHDLNPVIAMLRLAALGTLLSWAFLVANPRCSHLRRMLKRAGVPFLVAGVVWSAVTVPFAISAERAWETWSGVHLKTFTMSLFLLASVTSLQSVKQAMAVHVTGAALLAFYYAKGGFPLWGSPVPMYDVNDLALHLNIALPFVLFFALCAPRQWMRLGLWGLVGLLTVSALMTQSRGAFLTIGILGAIMLVAARSIKLWMRCIPPVLVAVTYVCAPPATKERLSTLFTPTQDYNVDADHGRIEIWKRGLGYMSEHPIAGVGISNFPLAELTMNAQSNGVGANARAMVSHNSFIEVGAEAGYFGLLLFLLMIGVTFTRLARCRRRIKRKSRRLPDSTELVLACEVTMLSLASYCIGGFFLSMAYAPVLYSIIVLAAALDMITERALARVGPSTSSRLMSSPGKEPIHQISVTL